MKVIYHTDQKVPVKYWDANGRVPFAENTFEQARKVATLPFIHKHVALMPDAHLGKGATIGSVIPTKKAIIPAAVGVDLGCGMMAVQTSLVANDLPDSLGFVRAEIEKRIPHGRSANGGSGDQEPCAVEVGPLEVLLEVGLKPNDATEFDAWLNQTDANVVLTLTSPHFVNGRNPYSVSHRLPTAWRVEMGSAVS